MRLLSNLKLSSRLALSFGILGLLLLALGLVGLQAQSALANNSQAM